MDLEKAKKLSYDSIRKNYKIYLQSREFGRNTVTTRFVETFYLWNKAGRDIFWDTVFSSDFETVARDRLVDCLKANSSGDAGSLVNGYLSHL